MPNLSILRGFLKVLIPNKISDITKKIAPEAINIDCCKLTKSLNKECQRASSRENKSYNRVFYYGYQNADNTTSKEEQPQNRK